MDLHRTSGKPDWHNIDIADQNIFQRIASRTSGILTPANVISVVGLAMVIFGLWMIVIEQVWLGLVLLVAGRMLDLLDGFIAEATQTKSPLGEMVDAVADKLATLLTVGVLFAGEVASWWLIILLIAPQVLISLTVFIKRQKGVSIHPTRPGKFSMALVWIGVVGLLVAHGLSGDLESLNIINYIVVIAAAVLGFVAMAQYIGVRK